MDANQFYPSTCSYLAKSLLDSRNVCFPYIRCCMALGVREWTVPFWQEVRKKDAPETLDGQVGTWQYWASIRFYQFISMPDLESSQLLFLVLSMPPTASYSIYRYAFVPCEVEALLAQKRQHLAVARLMQEGTCTLPVCHFPSLFLFSDKIQIQICAIRCHSIDIYIVYMCKLFEAPLFCCDMFYVHSKTQHVGNMLQPPSTHA